MNKKSLYTSPRFNARLCLLSTAICGLVAAADSSYAQNESTRMLEEVIVTVQKRAESLQDVPIAASAFSSENLQDRGLVSGPDLQLAIPNVSFRETGFGLNNFQIRGIGAQIQGTSADTGVGVHVNNIPLTVNRLASAEMFDIDRVEVLRGPQGTLYGRNATGGVLNIFTAKPSMDFSAKLGLEYGNYNTRRVKGHINIPVSDTFAIRAAGTMIKRDGTIHNVATGNDVESRDIWSTRLSSAWTPNDNFSLGFIWEHFEQDDSSGGKRKIICAPDAGPTSVGGTPIAEGSPSQAILSGGCLDYQAEDDRNNGVVNSLHTIPGTIGSFLIPAVTGNPDLALLPLNANDGKVVSTDLHTIESSLDPYNTAENDQYALDWQYSFDSGLTLSSITSYSEDGYIALYPTEGGVPDVGLADTPFSPGGVIDDPQIGRTTSLNSFYFLRQTAEQYSQELRLQSDYDGGFNFSVGGIYIDLEKTNEVIAVGAIPPVFANIINSVSPPDQQIGFDNSRIPDGTGHNYYNSSSPYELDASALFGEIYFDISDAVKATIGLRYTQDKKSQTSYPILFLSPGIGFPDTPEDKVTFKETTGRFTLDWKPTDDTLVYASLSRGYKGGGFNPRSNIGGYPAAFDPEFVNALEIGTKATLLDGRASTSVTGFYYDYDGYQISRVVNQTVINENVDASIWGLEIEAKLLLTENFSVDTQVGYLKTEIKDGSSINILDRTQGNPDLVNVNSLDAGSLAAGCVIPTAEAAAIQAAINSGADDAPPPFYLGLVCSGEFQSDNAFAGVPQELEGNELPDAPSWTVSIGAEYSSILNDDWEGIARVDYYRQDDNYARIYNTLPDLVKGYDNLNLSYRLFSDDKGIEIQFYARNLLSEDAITAIEFTGDSLGSTRYVSGKERPMYGLSLSKRW